MQSILVVDIGGSNVKVAADGHEKQKAATGSTAGPEDVVQHVRELTSDWHFDVVTVGCPVPVVAGRPAADPVNLGPHWQGFDFATAFGRPTRVLNDAVMQAIGGYRQRRMLFLGLGTGLGTALIDDGHALGCELAHLPYRDGHSYEDFVGKDGLARLGRKKWERHVHRVVGLLRAALLADEVLLGGGNSRELRELPAGSRRGDNSDAIAGGFRVWREAAFAQQFPVQTPA